MRLFWAKGYHATSLKDLEAALNMRPGSIYAAFSSKEALYLAALQRYFERSRDDLRARLEEAPSPVAALAGLLRATAGVVEDEAATAACMIVKTLLDTTAAEPEIADRSRGYLDAMRDEFAAAFERAQAQGEIAPDADAMRLARRFQSQLNALRIEAHRGTPRAELDALADDMARGFEDLRAATISAASA